MTPTDLTPELAAKYDHLKSTLRELGSERAWVVHADDGLDEISTLGPTRISELNAGQVRTWKFDPTEVGIERVHLADLQVQNVDEAAALLQDVLAGNKGPARDIAALNAAAAIVVAGQSPSLPEALIQAYHALDSGAARATLQSLVEYSHA